MGCRRRPTYGRQWFNELIQSVQSLQNFPKRCPRSRESERIRRDIRCLLFGAKRHRYRILYEIDDTRETVWILHIRHGARKDMAADEIAKPPS